MARHKHVEWNLPDGSPQGNHQWPSIHAAILMDIRDELRQLNMLAVAVVHRAFPDLLVPVKTPPAKGPQTRAARRKKGKS